MGFTGGDGVVAIALAIAMVTIFTGPVGAAIGTWIRRGEPPSDDATLGTEVDHLRGRLAEVEERLDFAERLLAQTREADQLHGGTQP